MERTLEQAFWRSIVGANYAVPGDYAVAALTTELLTKLGSTPSGATSWHILSWSSGFIAATIPPTSYANWRRICSRTCT